MSQKSFLELLSVTNNAVKALDKTSSSRSSGSGGGTPRLGVAGQGNAENRPPATTQEVHGNSRSSADSGVGKTVTQSNQTRLTKETLPAVHDSHDSTTASDVLIHSTLVDHPSNQPVSLNSSASSQGSRCRELDNFNVADAKKVKVSKKQLREIVSPRDSHDSANQPGYLSGHCETNLNMNNNNQKSSYKPENGKVINGSLPRKAVPDAEMKSASKYSDSSKMFKDQKKPFSQGMDGSTSTSTVAYSVERHDCDVKGSSLKKQVGTETGKANLGSQQFTHFPYKILKQGTTTKDQTLIEPEDQAEHWDEQSIRSSQPEIVTVEERIVNISSQALMLSDFEDSASQGSVSAANQPSKHQCFPNPRPKAQGPGLRQGALTQGSAMLKAGKGEEVQISKFSLSDKQREVREALSKRGTQSKPVKRVVQPKMVHSRASSLDGEDLNKNNNMDTGEGSATGGAGGASQVQSITAAVAASAAVAATQPFLKMQQDLENKMQSLLAEMDRVQKQVGGAGGGGLGGSTVDASGQHHHYQGGGGGGSNPRLEHLEQQVTELTERRLQHLETLQSQQMQLQAHLLSISRDMSQPRHPPPTSHHHPTYFPTTSHHSSGSSKPQYDRAMIERELMRGRLQAEEERRGGGYDQRRGPDLVKSSLSEPAESALDTPNPRSRQPRPAQFGGAKGGLLQEILAAEPSPQLNTTFNMAHDAAPSGRTRKRERLPRPDWPDQPSPGSHQMNFNFKPRCHGHLRI